MWFQESSRYFCNMSLTEELTNGDIVNPTTGPNQRAKQLEIWESWPITNQLDEEQSMPNASSHLVRMTRYLEATGLFLTNCGVELILDRNPMMTSSNGNIFRVTGHLCGEFTGLREFLAQRPVTWNFDIFLDLRQNKRLSKHSWGWWFETVSCPLWRQCNM